jgi:iron complex outermembrane receptor protein
MKIIFILASIFCLASLSVGQEATITGKVTSFGIPVEGVTVSVISSKGAEYSTVTNKDGEYKLKVEEPGDYRLTIFKNNVAILNTTATAVRTDSTRASFTTIELPGISEVVNVAAGETQPIEKVSKTVDVIDGQQMRERADFALVETLRTIPGFRVQQLGGFGRLATIKTRGLRNQDTAVLIDGIRFRDPSAITGDASPFLSDFTLTSVSRIEVLRGSGSSLYGTNAIGGVVDFQTPNARSGTHGQIAGAFGGLGLARFRGLISHGLENGKFGIGGGVSRTVYTKGIDGDDRAANTNFQTRIDANPFRKTNISGRIFFSDADVKLNSSPDTSGTLPSPTTIIDAIAGVNFTPDLNDPDSFQRSRFSSGQISATQILAEGVFLRGYYQGLTTRRTNDNGALGTGFQSASTSIFDGRIDTGNVNVSWSAGGKNTLTGGYEFEREKFGNIGRTPSGSGNFTTDATQRSSTFYAQNLASLLDGTLQLAGGVRVQRFSLGAPEFSLTNAPYSSLSLVDPPTAVTFDGAASYFVRKSGTKFRAHVGNGYRVPSLYERFGTFFSTFGTPSFVALGDPFLKPEKTTAFDVGIEQAAANDRVRLSATYFYTRLSDVVGFGNVVPNIGTTTRPFGGYENQKGGIARGGEFSVKLKPKNCFELFSSYTFTNSDQRTPQVTGNPNLKTLGVPDHQFTVVLTQRYKSAWVNVDFLATSTYLAPIFSNSTFSTYIYRFGGNRRGDVTAGYNFGFRKDKLNLRVYGTIENIFDNEYYENGFRTSGATARFGTTFSF